MKTSELTGPALDWAVAESMATKFRFQMNLRDGLLALIHKGVTDAAPLCDSIKRAQKFTGKGLTQASPPDKIQPSTERNLNAAKLALVEAKAVASEKE